MTCPHRWDVVPLGSVAEFRNGINYSKENFGSGIKVINVKDFQDHLVASSVDLDEINPTGVVRPESTLQPGDILFVRSNGNRELIGRSLYVREVPEPITHSAFSIRLRFTTDTVQPRFYAYVFRSQLIRGVLVAEGNGTNISNLNQQILSRLEIPLPPLAEQRRIAGVLSAYDDLIENNARRIAILEEVAQAIYREWFVNFRFPGHEQVEMVESEQGPLPAGWEVRRLGEIASAVRRNVEPKNRSEEVFAHFSIPAFDTDRQPALEEGAGISSTKHEVPTGVVLISKLNPRIPRVWLPELPAGHRSICSTEFVVLEPTMTSQTHLFGLLSSHDFLARLAARAGGTSTSHQRVKPADLLSMQVVEPSFEYVTRFTAQVSPMLSLVAALRRKNRTLRQTRDFLLPKLISGEIEIPAAEDALAGAAA